MSPAVDPESTYKYLVHTNHIYFLSTYRLGILRYLDKVVPSLLA